MWTRRAPISGMKNTRGSAQRHISEAERTRIPYRHTARPFHRPRTTSPAALQASKHGPYQRWLALSATAVSRRPADFCGPSQDQVKDPARTNGRSSLIAPASGPAWAQRTSHPTNGAASRTACSDRPAGSSSSGLCQRPLPIIASWQRVRLPIRLDRRDRSAAGLASRWSDRWRRTCRVPPTAGSVTLNGCAVTATTVVLEGECDRLRGATGYSARISLSGSCRELSARRCT